MTSRKESAILQRRVSFCTGREVMTELHGLSSFRLLGHKLLQEAAGLAVIFKFMMLNADCTILT